MTFRRRIGSPSAAGSDSTTADIGEEKHSVQGGNVVDGTVLKPKVKRITPRDRNRLGTGVDH